MNPSDSALRTSLTHPLVINTVTAAAGTLGLTFCPGKKQQKSMTGGWHRDVDVDVRAVCDWGADIVISLMEHFEYGEIGVPDMPATFTRHFQLWLDLPIIDKRAPDAQWLQHWRLVRLIVAQGLLDGRKVLIHCKGGIGRTGTIAAMILKDLGEDMPQAIARVRAARQGAIETREQEQFLESYQLPVIAPRALRCAISLLNGALGDAIGGPLEFMDSQTIANQFPEGLATMLANDTPLCITDDTQMTLYTLAGLLDVKSAGDWAHSVRDASLAWYSQQVGNPARYVKSGHWTSRLLSDPTVNAVRAPGATCLSALAAGGNGSVSEPINQSKGCGGVMRVAPMAWLADNADAALASAVKAAAMTHGHPLGYQSAGLLAWLLWQRLEDNCRLADVTARLLANWSGYDELLLDLLQWALEFADQPGAPARHPQLLGEGWVGEEALAIGLCHAIRSEASDKSLSEILWDAAAHDGDSDSTAAIAGNLIVAPRYDTVAMKALSRLDAIDCLVDFSEALLVKLRRDSIFAPH